jgi:EAL domain-containing protein (putative c-di-GMP-specific phosphodiesterase class I)
VEDTEITITVTLGVASMSREFFPVQTAARTPGILAQADMAMKRAKERRLPFLVYTHTMNIPLEYEENIRWTHQVKQSIRNDQVVPFYQPIFSNASGRIEKFECLMRIVDGDENIIYPEQFLRISKRSRQYPTLTRIMLRKIIREMKTTDCLYAFNISVEDMQNRGTVGFIRTILSNHPEEAKRITFEILESENIEGIPEVSDFVRMVKEFGSSIALDDFGTGYSNFSYILTLDVDYIKIDASIIRNLDCDENAVAIAETIIGFAKRTGKKTIAEFVHSEAVHDLVREMGVDYSQGYYLGKPRSSSAADSETEAAKREFSGLL